MLINMSSGNSDICALCEKNSFVEVANKLRTGESHKIYKCNSCEHIQLLPRPSAEEDREYYNKDKQEKAIRSDINLDNLRINSECDVQRRADFIANRFPIDSTILDIGCGYGFFLTEILRRGYKVRGVEVSRDRRELIKRVKDYNVLDIDFTEIENSDIEKVDLATLFHVIEHIADPIRFLRNIKNILRENGCLIIEVPNVEELMLKTCVAYNNFYWIRAHLHYFRSKTLGTVLKKAGFKKIEIIHVQRYGVENLCNWLMTEKPQLEKPKFKIKEPYGWIEGYYREYLEKNEKSDTLFVIAYL